MAAVQIGFITVFYARNPDIGVWWTRRGGRTAWENGLPDGDRVCLPRLVRHSFR